MVLNYSHPSQSGKTSPTPDGPPQTQALFKVDRMPIMRRYIKHATLVENCYPYPVPSDAKPKSNELSYLVYYANSKPAKLAKVGVYLERKIQRELYKRKPRMVEVSLEIFNALLDSCRSDLNYFTKPILNSLRAILISETTELMWAVTRTFIKFCQQYNGSTLAIDLHLRSVYQFLIKQFSAYALQGRSDPELTQKFRYAGLRALNAVVVSELIRVADSHKELVVIIPAVLENLKGTWPTDQDKKHLRAEWKQIENLGLHDPEVNSQTNHSLAWITMKAMVEHSNSINARFFITQTVEFIDRVNSSWSPSSPIVHLFTHIMAALQPQYRFILVTELLHQLSQLDVSLPNTEESGGANRPGTISSSVALASAGGEESKPPSSRESVAVPNSRDLATVLSGAPLQGNEAALVHAILESSYEVAPKKFCLVRLLSTLLNSQFLLVGLSVMEILDILLRHLLINVLLQDEEEVYASRHQPMLRQAVSLERFSLALHVSAHRQQQQQRAVSQSDQVGGDGVGPKPLLTVPGQSGIPNASSRSLDNGRRDGTPTMANCGHLTTAGCSCSKLALGSMVVGSPPMGKSISHTGVGTRDTPGQAMESQGGKSATLTSNPLMVTPRKPSNSTLNSDQPTSPGDSTPLLLGGNASMCSSSTSQVRIGDIIAELVSAIGGLGSHTYYGEQIADIISHIMEELHIPDDSWGEESVASGSSVYRERLGSTNLGGLEVTSPRQIGKLRIVLLRALSGMLRASLRSRFRAPNMIVSNVSLGLITPTTFLFGDADPSVRLHYAQFIINFLYHQNIEYFRSLGIFTTVTAQELTTESSTGQGQSSRGSDLADHTVGTCSMDMLPVSASSLALSSMKYQPSVSQNIVHSRRTLLIDIETRSLLHRALFQYATQTSNTTNDVIGIGVILILLLQRYTHEEFVLVTPVLLKIQNFAKELLTKLGVALHTMVVMYLSTVARLFELPSLSTYLDELVGQRKVRALWDKHVEHCLQLERLESVHYHLFELSLGDSETCAIRTIPSRSGELPGKLAEVTDPNQPGSEDMSAIHGEYDDSTLLSAARLLECFGTNKQLLREYPDLPSRLAGEYPIVELRTLVKPRIARKMASRSQIRASLNLEPFKNTTVRPFKESSALSPPLNGVSQPTEPSFQPTLMTCSMLNGLADRKSLPSSPGLPRTNSSQGLAKIPKETAEVRVENLREALYVQIPPDSSEPDTDSETHHYTNPRSSYRGGEHIRSNSPFPGHSPRRNTGKPRPNEVQNLLQSISASSPHLSFQGGLLSNTPDFRHPF